jgi:hypothetical protein
MQTQELDLNALRQLLLKIRTDFIRIQSHINQTPETHIGDVAQDPNWTPPESST